MLGDKGAADHESRGAAENRSSNSGRPANSLGEVFAEETGAGQRVVDAAQAIEAHLPQAAADRIADDQGPADHRRTGNDRRHDGQIRPPVVAGSG